MRELLASDRNEITVVDGRSGSEIVLYYRTPTSKEEVLYQANLIKRKGKKVLVNGPATRMRFGIEILTGFRDGDFGVGGKPISSDPASPNYCEDWKEVVKEGASDIVRALAAAVFEGVRVGSGDEAEIALAEEELADEEPLDEEAKSEGEELVLEEAGPLGTSSEGSASGAPRS